MHIKDAHKRAEPTRYIKHFFTRPSGKESLENDCKWKAHLTKKPQETDEPSVCSSGLIIFFFLLAVEPGSYSSKLPVSARSYNGCASPQLTELFPKPVRSQAKTFFFPRRQ